MPARQADGFTAYQMGFTGVLCLVWFLIGWAWGISTDVERYPHIAALKYQWNAWRYQAYMQDWVAALALWRGADVVSPGTAIGAVALAGITLLRGKQASVAA